MNRPRPTQRLPWQVKFVLLAFIWGSSFLLMKLGLRALAPVQIASLRILTGAVAVLILLHVRGGRLPRGRRVWGHLAVGGLLLMALPFVFFALAETRVSSALAGIGNAFTPIAMVVVTFFLLPSEKVTRAQVLAVGLGFGGVLVVSEFWANDARPDPLGFALAVAGGCCYGLGWPYLRRHLAGVDLGGLSQPAALLCAGSVLTVPITVGWWWTVRDEMPTPWSLAAPVSGGTAAVAVLATVLLGAVGTGLAYTLQFDVVRAAGTVVGGMVTYLVPLVSVALGVLVLGEQLAAAQLIGFALILSAAFVIGRPQSRPHS